MRRKITFAAILSVLLLILAGCGDKASDGNAAPAATEAPAAQESAAPAESGEAEAEVELETEPELEVELETEPEPEVELEPEAVMAPDFSVFDLEGNEVFLSDMRGKPVVLNFWATWCGPCQSEMPHFQSLYEEYGDRVEFMMVDLTDGVRDTQQAVLEFITEKGYTFPVYCDTSLYAASVYGAYSIPLTFFINSRGEALYYQSGPMSEDMLRSAIETMLEGETLNEDQA